MAEPSSSVPDPFAAWRDWLSQSERQWNTFFNDVMATPQFNEAQKRFMDTYLAMHRSMSDSMGRYLRSLDMPTRTDVLALAQRLSVIEDRLGAIERALARLGGGGQPAGDDDRPSASATAVVRPARTRTPGMP